MLKAYIDPGTGSMLFAILIGIFGAAGFFFRNIITKLRFALSAGKNKELMQSKQPLVIFSDDKRYWKNFEPICRELDKRGFEVTYMTASPDDPVLENPYPNIHGQFIGSGNKAFAKMNFLNATMVLSTTPGLDVYQWKRSKNVDYYIHIPHAASDITIYRMFGIDYYDSVMVSGKYQIDQIRKLEKLRGLPAKEIVLGGLPYMDEMVKRYTADKIEENTVTTVLLAPSWGKSAIFSKYGGKIIEELLKTDCDIIIRPHPQSVISEKKMLNKLMAEFPESDRLKWNFDNDNYEALKISDIMISDFSGVIFDFTLVYDKPVIYADTEFDKSPYDAWWLDEPLWTFTALPRIGAELREDNIESISEIIEDCLHDPKYSANRAEVRKETWENYGKGAEIAADYIIEKYNDLLEKQEER